MKLWTVAPLLLLAVLLPTRSFGELSHRALRGIEAWVDHPGASPLDGYTVLKTVLPNRRLLGHYGAPRPGLGCLEFASRTHEQLLANDDCPQDKNSEWIQRLFPSQDRAHLLMNQIPSDVVSHFTPVAIGRLLESVTQIADAEWIDAKTHAEIREKVTARLADVLLETMNPEKFAEWQEKQQRDLQKQLRVRSWKKSISEEDRKLQAEWERITATLARFSAAAEAPRPRLGSLQEASAFEGWEVGPSPPDSSSRLSPASAGSGASDSSSAERIGKRKDYLAVAELFVAALLESRGQTATYPKYFPEQTLLAFFVQKAEKKEDLMALFRGMPGLLRNPSALADASAVSAFIANQWTDADYDRELSKARLKIKAERFAEDREFMIYFLMEDKARTQLIPPMVMYSQAGHESMGKATYPDCGETSLRNFFNILLYRPERGIFDANVLTEQVQRP